MPVPKLRFKEDNEKEYPEWKSFNFFSIITKIVDFRGRTPLKLGTHWAEEKTKYLALSALNVKNGYIDKNSDTHYGDKELYELWMRGNELYKGQTLLTMEAPAGNVAQVPDDEPYILSQRTVALCPNPEIITDGFLARVLSSPKVQKKIMTLATGGTAKGISQKSLKFLDIKIPSLPEQGKIADFLSSYDRMIDVQSRRVEAMRTRKKGLLQKIFSQEIRFKDDHGQEYPEWKCSKLSECTKLIKDGTHGTHKNVDEGYPLLSAKDILGNKITIPKDCRKIDKQDYEAIYKNYRLKNDDLLLTIVGTIGRVGYYSSEYGEIAFQRSVAIIRMNDLILPRFMLFELMASKFQIELAKRQSQSAQAGIYLGELSSIPIYYPSLPEQQKIADFLTAVDKQIDVEEKRLETMKTIKKGLLQQMFI